ncbi:type IV secretory system conjugative DNA transfer family protein [Phenylobacterium sp.]|uniref:type IV secretory system conjugative DNA transfer family protein n=1 Tax=Phenylobacterium sp. TaxID=1871053 RepID=UPI0025E1E3F6|nr:type IV secretory system conjugative DNA transfer family protein [Phenylobacterium sp.]
MMFTTPATASEPYGPHNTILDNCHVYTAFSALDPMTQDKVSRLTGTVLETRASRSGPAGLAAGRRSVSHAEVERPLLEPGEIRAMPDDVQLTFVAGGRPLRTRKVRYDRREPFRSRARIVPPDAEARPDTPGTPPHPWAGRRALGEDRNAKLPLFKETGAAIDEKKAAQVAEAYQRLAEDYAAQAAVLDHLQGSRHG